MQTPTTLEKQKKQVFPQGASSVRDNQEVVFIPVLKNGNILVSSSLILKWEKELAYFPSAIHRDKTLKSKHLPELLEKCSDLKAQRFTKACTLIGDGFDGVEVYLAWGCEGTLTTNSVDDGVFWSEKSLSELLSLTEFEGIADEHRLVLTESTKVILAEVFDKRGSWVQFVEAVEVLLSSTLFGAYTQSKGWGVTSNPFRNTLKEQECFSQWERGWLLMAQVRSLGYQL